MRTIKTNVYRFSELSNKAKASVKQKFAEQDGYQRTDEAIASLKAMAEWFDGKMADYQVSFFDDSHSSARFQMPEPGEIESDDDDIMAAFEKWLKGKLDELGTYNAETLRGNGDCKLTGYCTDEDCIDGFRAAYHAGERDLVKLMEAGFQTWLKAAQADCADQYSDETFSDFCDANDYEFYDDGRMV